MKIHQKSYNPCDDCQYSCSKQNQEHVMCKICEFKKYRSAEEQGLLLRLTCKVGDEFWVIAYRDNKIIRVRCTGYTIQVDSINKVNHAYVWLDSVYKQSDYWKIPFEEFKCQCFSNYDEAEKALAEMG